MVCQSLPIVPWILLGRRAGAERELRTSATNGREDSRIYGKCCHMSQSIDMIKQAELHQPVTMAKPWRVHRNLHAVRVLHCSKRLRLEPAASARNFGLQNGMPPRRITFKGHQKSRWLWLQGISSRWNHKKWTCSRASPRSLCRMVGSSLKKGGLSSFLERDGSEMKWARGSQDCAQSIGTAKSSRTRCKSSILAYFSSLAFI